jgi:hypothetical protein
MSNQRRIDSLNFIKESVHQAEKRRADWAAIAPQVHEQLKKVAADLKAATGTALEVRQEGAGASTALRLEFGMKVAGTLNQGVYLESGAGLAIHPELNGVITVRFTKAVLVRDPERAVHEWEPVRDYLPGNVLSDLDPLIDRFLDAAADGHWSRRKND